MAGRITLVRLILLAIPNYFMYTVRIPILVCNKIKKIARNFIWGTTVEARKPALLSWKDCCRPLEHEGLGLRSLADQNKVFLLKLGYCFLSHGDALWVRILQKKYNLQGVLPISIRCSNCSYILRSHWDLVSCDWKRLLVNRRWLHYEFLR